MRNGKSPPVSERFLNRLLGYERSSIPYKQNAARFFRKLLASGSLIFRTDELVEKADIPLKKAVNMCSGMASDKLVVNLSPRAKKAVYQIRLQNPTPIQSIDELEALHEERKGTRESGITTLQRDMVSRLYEQFGEDQFTLGTASNRLHVIPSTLYFHLNNLMQREILTAVKKEGSPAYHYSLLVTPAKNPECFLPAQTAAAVKQTRHVAIAAAGARSSGRIAL